MPSRYFLAPLAGYTNLALRRTLRELGGLGLATTDLVNARALLKGGRKTLELIATTPDDRPTAVQIYGAEPEYLRAAAQYLEAAGFGHIDINMGCPVHKVVKGGGGSAMMCDTTGKTVELVRSVVDGVKIPVTVKMRLGWDERQLSAPYFAREFEQIGVAAITIHGRTRARDSAARSTWTASEPWWRRWITSRSSATAIFERSPTRFRCSRSRAVTPSPSAAGRC